MTKGSVLTEGGKAEGRFTSGNFDLFDPAVVSQSKISITTLCMTERANEAIAKNMTRVRLSHGDPINVYCVLSCKFKTDFFNKRNLQLDGTELPGSFITKNSFGPIDNWALFISKNRISESDAEFIVGTVVKHVKIPGLDKTAGAYAALQKCYVEQPELVSTIFSLESIFNECTFRHTNPQEDLNDTSFQNLLIPEIGKTEGRTSVSYWQSETPVQKFQAIIDERNRLTIQEAQIIEKAEVPRSVTEEELAGRISDYELKMHSQQELLVKIRDGSVTGYDEDQIIEIIQNVSDALDELNGILQEQGNMTYERLAELDDLVKHGKKTRTASLAKVQEAAAAYERECDINDAMRLITSKGVSARFEIAQEIAKTQKNLESVIKELEDTSKGSLKMTVKRYRELDAVLSGNPVSTEVSTTILPTGEKEVLKSLVDYKLQLYSDQLKRMQGLVEKFNKADNLATFGQEIRRQNDILISTTRELQAAEQGTITMPAARVENLTHIVNGEVVLTESVIEACESKDAVIRKAVPAEWARTLLKSKAIIAVVILVVLIIFIVLLTIGFTQGWFSH